VSDAKVFHAHLWGTRKHKYAELRESSIAVTDWTELDPDSPFYLLVPLDTELLGEYGSGWPVTDALPVHSVGIATARDHLTIRWSRDDLWETVRDFAGLGVEKARAKYRLRGDVRDWKVHLAQADVRSSGPTEDGIVRVLYRPFDRRWTYYTGKTRGFICMPRPEVMHHLLAGPNVALITSRLTKGETYRHAQTTRGIVEVICMSPKTSNNGFVFPVYLYPRGESLFDEADWTRGPGGRVPNLSPEFLSAMAERLGLTFVSDGVGDLGLGSGGAARNAAVPAARASGDAGVTRSAAVPAAGASGDAGSAGTFGPEDVFHYIYAVFHAPTYRERYAEFLKIDFPRVPLTSDLDLFRALCGLGADLVALHLLEDDYAHASWTREGQPCPLRSPITRYPLPGDNTVAKGHPKYLAPGAPEPGTRNPVPSGRVYISKDDRRAGTQGQYFEGVPPEVWAFHIGGYQVCEKWLKDRRGRRLSYEDLTHYKRVVVALNETIRLMSEIDAAIDAHGGWPLS